MIDSMPSVFPGMMPFNNFNQIETLPDEPRYYSTISSDLARMNITDENTNPLSSFSFEDAKSRRSQNTTETVIVPSSEHVAEIVGRQGCKIKALRAKTNTYIKTPVRGEEPVFMVTGRREDVVIAKQEISAAAEHFSQIRASRKQHPQPLPVGLPSATPPIVQPGHITIQVKVPYRVVGLVVGPKGATIKSIQQQTHTYIVTPSRDKDPVFEVTGNPDNVQRAREKIESHIAARTGQLNSSDESETGSSIHEGDCFSRTPNPLTAYPGARGNYTITDSSSSHDYSSGSEYGMSTNNVFNVASSYGSQFTTGNSTFDANDSGYQSASFNTTVSEQSFGQAGPQSFGQTGQQTFGQLKQPIVSQSASFNFYPSGNQTMETFKGHHLQPSIWAQSPRRASDPAKRETVDQPLEQLIPTSVCEAIENCDTPVKTRRDGEPATTDMCQICADPKGAVFQLSCGHPMLVCQRCTESATVCNNCQALQRM